jgi:hypothetical protein
LPRYPSVSPCRGRCQASADHDAIPDPAPTTSNAALPADLTLEPTVTVSGLSSGGFFAHQFHVAHSGLVAGAGIVAGGPYGCVETISNPYWPFATLDRLSAALVACTHYWGDRFWGLRPSPPDASDSVELIEDAFDDGRHRRSRPALRRPRLAVPRRP